MWRRNRWIQQKNRRRHCLKRRCLKLNHCFDRRNQLIRRRNCQQRCLIRNLRQKRSCLSWSQSLRRIRLWKQIRKCLISHWSLRTHHRKIINHRSQHQRRNLSHGRIKQIRIFQPHHGFSLSRFHFLLRIFRQRYLQNGRLKRFHRRFYCWWLKKWIRCWIWIQSLRIRITQNQKRCLISQSWCRHQIKLN